MQDMTKENQHIFCNLQDAGCDEDTIVKFFQLQKENKQQEQYRLLTNYRTTLLDAIHRQQRRIDCLDYLLYMMDKE